jgi:hypothetical protein
MKRSENGKGEAERRAAQAQAGSPASALLLAGVTSAEAWGNPLRRAIGAEPLSVLSTSVTKQTGDMVYSEARRRRFLSIGQRTKMLHALEIEWGMVGNLNP